MSSVTLILGGFAAFFVVALLAFIVYIFKTPLDRER
jgi:hypothetical protein